MSRSAAGTMPAAAEMEQLLSKLGPRLRQIGLTISFWDAAGAPVTEPSFCTEFCRHFFRVPKGFPSPGQAMGELNLCAESMSLLAQQACVDDRSQSAAGPVGCCLIAVPVRHRRRILGAMAACFAAPETPDTEAFARACGTAHLDRRAMAALCRREARHSTAEAETLAREVEWLIDDEQQKEAARSELATLSTNLASTYEELSLLYRITGSMRVTQTSMEFFAELCRELREVIRLEAAAVVLYPRQHSGESVRAASAGGMSLTSEQLIQLVQRYLMPRLGSSMRATIDNMFSKHAGHLGARVEEIRTLIAAPLTAGDECKGILLGINKIDGEFDTIDLKLIGSISDQAAVFLANHHLYEDLQDLLMGVLHALTSSIDAKDPYTCGHSRRVALISRKLAELSGFDGRRAGRLYLTGLLHDVGKIGMPEALLCKPGRLTEQEYVRVKQHPEVGARILSGIGQMEDLIPAIMHHHERIDGKGYPAGLTGGEIPIEAAIVGLADSFDAMTSSRTYRAAMPIEAVTAEIRRCSGTQFDSQLVEHLLRMDLPAYVEQLRQMSVGQDGPPAVTRGTETTRSVP